MELLQPRQPPSSRGRRRRRQSECARKTLASRPTAPLMSCRSQPGRPTDPCAPRREWPGGGGSRCTIQPTSGARPPAGCRRA
eukprot:11698564-Alexandrium_andersonii.AAC.1